MSARFTAPAYALLMGVLLLANAASSAETAVQVDNPICGDFDADRSLTLQDALGVLQGSVGRTDCPDCVCDTDSSGGVSATDALALIRSALDLEVELSCPGLRTNEWTGEGDGTSWEDHQNWSENRSEPQACDDVIIPAGHTVETNGRPHRFNPDRDPRVTYRAGRIRGAGGLAVNGGFFEVRGGIRLESGLTFEASGLRGATLHEPAGDTAAEIIQEGMVFSSVRIERPLVLGSASRELILTGNIELYSTLTIDKKGSLFVDGDAPVSIDGNGTISGTPSGGNMAVAEGATLELGSSLMLTENLRSVGGFGATVINHGRMLAADGSRIFVVGEPWINHGTIEARNGGRVHVQGFGTNTGTIAAGEAIGSRVDLTGDWHNDGTLVVDGGQLRLNGVFGIDDIGDLDARAGEVWLGGLLDNTDTRFTLGPDLSNVDWVLSGEIAGGTIDIDETIHLEALSAALRNTTLSAGSTIMGPVRLYERVRINGHLLAREGTRLDSIDEDVLLSGTGLLEFTRSPGTSGAVTMTSGKVTFARNLNVVANMTFTGPTTNLVNRATLVDDLSFSVGTFTNRGVLAAGVGGRGEIVNEAEIQLPTSTSLDCESSCTLTGSSSVRVLIEWLDALGIPGHGFFYSDESLSLGGELVVELVGEYDPEVGREFPFARWDGNVTGTFDTVTNVGVPEGKRIDIVYENDGAKLIVLAD